MLCHRRLGVSWLTVDQIASLRRAVPEQTQLSKPHWLLWEICIERSSEHAPGLLIFYENTFRRQRLRPKRHTVSGQGCNDPTSKALLSATMPGLVTAPIRKQYYLKTETLQTSSHMKYPDMCFEGTTGLLMDTTLPPAMQHGYIILCQAVSRSPQCIYLAWWEPPRASESLREPQGFRCISSLCLLSLNHSYI